MKKTPIICLASWYPNEIDHFEGDFIQRKLQALSIYRPVHLFHVKKHAKEQFKNTETINAKGALEEHIHYTNSGGTGVIYSIKNYWTFFKKHNAFLKNHIKSYGKPKTILVQVPYNAGIIALYWKKRYGIDYILTEHYGIYNNRYEANFNTRSSIYKYIVKRIITNSKKLITVSHALASDINQMVTKKEYSKLSNVVDTNLFKYKTKTDVKPFIFCHLSNMIPVKNITGMIHAAKILADKEIDFKLNLIGGDNKDHQALAEKLNLKNKTVFFKNAVSYDKVASVLQESHALLMFSNTESQSCISLEALCTGTPVISSKAGGIEEHLNTSNSLLVNCKDEEGLANAMINMIKNYAGYNQEEIANDNQSFWNYKQIGKEYHQLIENTLS